MIINLEPKIEAALTMISVYTEYSRDKVISLMILKLLRKNNIDINDMNKPDDIFGNTKMQEETI